MSVLTSSVDLIVWASPTPIELRATQVECDGCHSFAPQAPPETLRAFGWVLTITRDLCPTCSNTTPPRLKETA